MAILAEEIDDEWLNSEGWVTIRGIKMGHDIDILAIKPTRDGVRCHHVEVKVSFNPVYYFTKVPKAKRFSVVWAYQTPGIFSTFESYQSNV